VVRADCPGILREVEFGMTPMQAIHPPRRARPSYSAGRRDRWSHPEPTRTDPVATSPGGCERPEDRQFVMKDGLVFKSSAAAAAPAN